MAITEITYNDKSDINTTSTPEVNKITASNINEIKSVVNNNATELTNVINAEVYSTNEVKTNKVWIDGKPIYRIVASINLQDYASWTNLVHISNLKRVINIYGSLNNINIPRYESSNYFTQFLYENNYIKVMCNGNTGSGYLVIEYTKTTD